MSTTTIYTTAGPQQWSMDTNCQWAELTGLGGGGGGGSGQRAAINVIRGGGAGGSGGGYTSRMVGVYMLTASTTLFVGRSGLGGAGVTTDSVNGSSGEAGGSSYFGQIFRAGGGGQGFGGAGGS